MNKRKVSEVPNPKHPDVDTATKPTEIVGSTKFGKDLIVQRLPSGYGYYITISGSRLVGRYLEGTFTSYKDALNAIEMYVAHNKSKV